MYEIGSTNYKFFIRSFIQTFLFILMFVTVTVVGVGYISLVISHLKCLVGIPNGTQGHEIIKLFMLNSA